MTATARTHRGALAHSVDSIGVHSVCGDPEVCVSVFDAALVGRAAALVDSDGATSGLEVQRWRRPADIDDGWLLDRCQGPTVDLGCGPGRLLTALVARGVRALGVDHSPVAQAHCRRRAVTMVLGDLYTELPDEGRWHHVLLADGNIGIGGDPGALVARACRLLRPDGTLLVETDPDARQDWQGTVQVRTSKGLGPRIPWARVGSAALRRIAAVAGLVEVAARDGQRCFVELARQGYGSGTPRCLSGGPGWGPSREGGSAPPGTRDRGSRS